MKLEIYKTATPGQYSWRLKMRGNEIARMPDATAHPSKIKRTVRALRDHSTSAEGFLSPIAMACVVSLAAFEKLHPSRVPH